MPSLSSPLLLRNHPHTFAFIPILPMSLSSLNRSNSKAFRHILPCVAPVCGGMHYHKTGVPWQMNNTFILLILSPYISSKPCKYWLSSLYTHFSKTAFFLINSCIFSCFFGHFGYKWVIFLIRKALRNKSYSFAINDIKLYF